MPVAAADDIKHWRALQVNNALKAAPMLEFAHASCARGENKNACIHLQASRNFWWAVLGSNQ
jgi:hypothetical protein